MMANTARGAAEKTRSAVIGGNMLVVAALGAGGSCATPNVLGRTELPISGT